MLRDNQEMLTHPEGRKLFSLAMTKIKNTEWEDHLFTTVTKEKQKELDDNFNKYFIKLFEKHPHLERVIK